jgi:hypothetical protein
MVSANQSPTIVTITSPGPQGPQGPTGPPGGATTGSNTFTGNQNITGSILISGSIIPAVGIGQLTSSFDLGSSTAAWKDIYVSNGSVKFITSGSTAVTLSAQNGGISVNGGSTITANGVSGQFITSKSLDTTVTVKDSNNSLLMGPIEVETNKEIIVEEGSDLTIFGDIDIQNVATADTALFSTSASYATSASYSNTSSYATTASYALNATSTSTFPYSGSAIITGSLVVNNGTNNIINTSNYQLLDSNGVTSIDWLNKVLKLADNRDTVDWGGARLNDYTSEKLSVDWEGRILYDTDAKQSIDWKNRKASDSSDIKSVDWASRLLTDSSGLTSVDWGNRALINSNGGTAIDYSNSSSLLLSASGSTFTIGKNSAFNNNTNGTLDINGGNVLTLSGSVIALKSPQGFYTLTSASSTITSSAPSQTNGNMTVAFTQVGSNYYMNVYIGGRWRSASLF